MAIDLNTPVGQLRLETGDITDIPILNDATYTYILAQHGNVVKDSVVDALRTIQGVLAQKTRERLDRIEFYGNQAFEQYTKFVEDKIKQLTGVGVFDKNAVLYAGGLYYSQVEENNSKPDLITVTTAFDCQSDTYSWN